MTSNYQIKKPIKILITFLFSVGLTGLTPAPSDSIEECQLIAKVLSNLGSSMSRHRLIIAEGSDPTIIDEASLALAKEAKLYSSAKRQYEKARCNGWRR